MAQQLYFAEHEGEVSTTARHEKLGYICVRFKVDAHKVGTPDREGADLLSVAGVTTTPQTCELCPKPSKRPSDQ